MKKKTKEQIGYKTKMIKYIIPNNKNNEYAHLEYCQKNKCPFITVKKQGTQYA